MKRQRRPVWAPHDQLDYVGQIIRPPSEADSIILQVTLGCSNNKCTFCPTYLGKPFAIKDRAIVEADLEKAARLYPNARRLFVADGDAVIMPMKHWEWLLPAIKEKLPNVDRVGAYSTGKAIRKKTDEELKWLFDNGLGIIYLGVESGDDETLTYIKKDSNAAQLIEAGQRARAAGFKLSVTVLLGIAPDGKSLQHARATGKLLTAMNPNYVGALTIILVEGTEMAAAYDRGEHTLPDQMGMLAELREMLTNTTLTRGLFMANHASNYLPIRVRMPSQKENTLKQIDEALKGNVALKDEMFRGL
jgi:radical SAM superfamily enzyme YgiQ (UPF0313 family)